MALAYPTNAACGTGTATPTTETAGEAVVGVYGTGGATEVTQTRDLLAAPDSTSVEVL